MIILPAFLCLPEIAFSQFSTLDNRISVWTDISAWENRVYPGTILDSGDIDSYGYLTSYTCLDFNNGELRVHDTLVIMAGLELDNGQIVRIDPEGILIVLGDYLSRNKVEVYNEGIIVVAGEFQMPGSDNQGLFSNMESGQLFIFDTEPELKTGTGYSDLLCYDTDDYPGGCGFGNRTDLDSSRISEFFHTLAYDPDREYGCNFFDFTSDHESACQSDSVVFTFTGNIYDREYTYSWSFGEDADPPEGEGFGPFTVVYTLPGEKTIQLNDGDKILLKEDYLKIAALPSLSLLDASTCGRAVLPVLAQNVTGHITYFSVDGGNTIYDSTYGPPHYTEYMIDTGEEITFCGRTVDTITGCSSGWEVTSLLRSSVYPEVTIVGDSIIMNGIPVILYLEDDFASYLWNDGSTLPEYTADSAGIVYVNVTDENGCEGNDDIEITEVIDSLDSPDTIPSGLLQNEIYAFSPNGDGYNDLWVIDGIEAYPGAKIVVVDKYGRTVYQNPGDYLNDWDGTCNHKKLLVDSYYFLIDLSQYDLTPVSGIVTILY